MPGGGPGAAACHAARAVGRRAERRAWTLARDASVNPASLKYLNRLSDLLFVLARVVARHEGGAEVIWRPYRGPTIPDPAARLNQAPEPPARSALRLARALSSSPQSRSIPSSIRTLGRLSRSASSKKRFPCRTAGSLDHCAQPASGAELSVPPPMSLATITSGAASRTASNATDGVRPGSSANTLVPPHTATPWPRKCRPVTVKIRTVGELHEHPDGCCAAVTALKRREPLAKRARRPVGFGLCTGKFPDPDQMRGDVIQPHGLQGDDAIAERTETLQRRPGVAGLPGQQHVRVQAGDAFVVHAKSISNAGQSSCRRRIVRVLDHANEPIPGARGIRRAPRGAERA